MNSASRYSGLHCLKRFDIEDIVLHKVYPNVDWRDILVVLPQIIAYENGLLIGRQLVDTIYEVASALDHSLVDELLERLLLTAVAVVVEELIPEPAVYKVTRSMLCSTNIQVDVAPVFVGFLTHNFLVVVRVHIPQIVCRRPCESRHRVELYREYGLIVDETLVDDLAS